MTRRIGFKGQWFHDRSLKKKQLEEIERPNEHTFNDCALAERTQR